MQRRGLLIVVGLLSAFFVMTPVGGAKAVSTTLTVGEPYRLRVTATDYAGHSTVAEVTMVRGTALVGEVAEDASFVGLGQAFRGS